MTFNSKTQSVILKSVLGNVYIPIIRNILSEISCYLLGLQVPLPRVEKQGSVGAQTS